MLTVNYNFYELISLDHGAENCVAPGGDETQVRDTLPSFSFDSLPPPNRAYADGSSWVASAGTTLRLAHVETLDPLDGEGSLRPAPFTQADQPRYTSRPKDNSKGGLLSFPLDTFPLPDKFDADGASDVSLKGYTTAQRFTTAIQLRPPQ